MKKLFIIILMQIALFAYSQQDVQPDSIATSLDEVPVTTDTQIGANTFEYRIVSNYADTTLNGYDCIMYNMSDVTTSFIGTIQNGKIEITGESNRTFPAFIDVMSNNNDNPKRFQIKLIVEPGTIIVDCNERFPVSGGDLNQKYKDYINKLNSLATDSDSQNKVWKDVFKENYDNGLGEYVLINAGFSCSPTEWADAISLLDDETKAMTGINNITERMEIIKLTWEGQPFIDLEGKSIDGKPVKLSDFVGKGKYVIADFWASWCGGCIIEARESLLPLYNEYKENPDVQFIGIAFDDVKEAVEKLELPWQQIMDCEKAMDIYSTYSIPEIVIFAPDGTILNRRLQGNETANKLHQILGHSNLH